MTTGDRPIDFTRGVPADESFPLVELAECAAAVVAGPHGVLVQQYGPSPGFGPLREWLAAQHGVPVDRVLVGNGSLQLIDLLGWALLARGDTVFVESPTYDRTLTLLRRHGIGVVGIPMAADGPELEAFEQALRRQVPKLFYTIPDFQNPSGATTSLAKRRRLVELAARHGFRILEDAPYRPLRYRGSDVPALSELDGERVLHMSSFTKRISPGVRSEAVRARAAERKLALSDGRGFFPEPTDGERFVRLPFCALTPAEIDEGIRRLAVTVEAVREPT